MKKIFSIILVALIISWASATHAADTDSQITIDVSTFTLTSNTPPARELNLNFQPQKQINLNPQKTTVSPNIAQAVIRDSANIGNLENTLYTTSLISLVALNVADYLTTRKALQYEGLAEGNPLMKPFVKNDLTFAAVKLGITIGNHLFMKNLYKKNKTLAWVLSVASNFAMSYVVANNLKMISSAQKQ